ncbi:MAG: serine protease [Gemmataceae bacterium]
MRPTDDGRFTVWGSARDGGNNTLQRDLRDYADDAERVRLIAKNLGDAEVARQTAMQNRELLDQYHRYITARWSISSNTERLFAEADSRLSTIANPYLEKVDAAISDAALRQVIRRIQPACVRINRASGVNIAADGLVLTNAHVAWRKGQTMTAEFPDGRTFEAKCIAIDAKFDLALCRLEKGDHLPVAKVAAHAPAAGDRVVCIGQPGNYTPSGERTNYQPFHVSVGKIRGLRGEPLEEQSPLGGTKHDAWTYWGHSGSPLFNESGEVVALHNSWDSATAMRHAVTHAAIVEFLKQNQP